MCLQYDSLHSIHYFLITLITFSDPSASLHDTSLHFAPFVRRSFVTLTSFGTAHKSSSFTHFIHALACSIPSWICSADSLPIRSSKFTALHFTLDYSLRSFNRFTCLAPAPVKNKPELKTYICNTK